MTDDTTKTKEGAALWRQARAGWRSPQDDAAPDALLLAAYLDGRLAEDEAARLEARLAGEPALLDELLALRESLAAGAGTAPAGVVGRAQAAFPRRAAAKVVRLAEPSLLDRFFGFALGPAVSALAGLALLVACAGALELGRYQAQQLDPTTQTADSGDSEVPVDLLMSGLL